MYQVSYPAHVSSELVTDQLPDFANDQPIAIYKVKHTCNQYPILNFVSYPHLSSSFKPFVSSPDLYLAPTNVSVALSISGWTLTKHEEMIGLEQILYVNTTT